MLNHGGKPSPLRREPEGLDARIFSTGLHGWPEGPGSLRPTPRAVRAAPSASTFQAFLPVRPSHETVGRMLKTAFKGVASLSE